MTPEMVGNLSLVQFNEIIHHLSKKITWGIQLAAIPGGNKLDNNHHPLAPEPRSKRAQEGEVKKDPVKDTSLEEFEVRLRNFIRK